MSLLQRDNITGSEKKDIICLFFVVVFPNVPKAFFPLSQTM